MPAKVLVTGATGFTGGHMCDHLKSLGFEVRALARSASKGKALADRGIEVVMGDLLDRESLVRATKDVTIVFHIGAMFRPENVTLQDMRQVNVEGTRNIIEAAIANDVKRFVHCSTVGVLGDVRGGPGTETTPYAPGDHYQVSKMEGELLAIEYMEKQKLPITICRPGPIYGPRDTRFLGVTRAIKKGRFAVIGSGDVIFQLVYVGDLVDGIAKCGLVDRAVGNLYILTGEEPITLNHLFATIADEVGATLPKWRIPYTPVYVASILCEAIFKPFGLSPPLYRRRVKFFKNQRLFDISKARAELGFKPETSLKEAVHRTVDWYRAEKLI